MECFEQLLYQLHISYLHARKNKRSTYNQLKFELSQEQGLIQLAKAIYERQYQPKPCIGFIIHKPVMREIFAADFSDRIVHHFIYRCIYPHIDKKLINDTYSCRKGKGTLYGINRLKHFIRSCTNNYSKPVYILKLDIEAYFMKMQHQVIYNKVVALLPEQKRSYLGISRDTLMYLLQYTIFNSVTENCRIKGSRNDWRELPMSKSLFHQAPNTGLPIGNLTSQVFGNIYLNDMDHYIKRILKIKYYGRYVDDMVFVHSDKKRLKEIIPLLQVELNKLGMQIHPQKIVLVSSDEGIQFLGQYVKPYRCYISNRTKNNFYHAIQRVNHDMTALAELNRQHLCDIRAILNSYLGIMKHANTYSLREAMLNKLCSRFYDFFYISEDMNKVILRKGKTDGTLFGTTSLQTGV
jgi:RNA-directed DNA polymerase